MLTRIFDSTTLKGMEKALDGAALRQKVIANNIANVDTPNYKAVEVTFEDQLRRALEKEVTGGLGLKTTHPRHISVNEEGSTVFNMEPQIRTVKGTSYRNDKNNVDIDREMAKNSENELYYNAVIRALNDEFKLLRTAITGR